MKKSDFQNVENVGVFPITNNNSIEVLFLDESEEKVYYAKNDGERKKVQSTKLDSTDSKGFFFTVSEYGRIYFSEISRNGAF